MNEISPRFQRLMDEQAAVLDHAAVTGCANRRGLRERSGSLLEAAFLELAARLAPTLSVEIGALEASFSERLKASLPSVHALAFEANPVMYRWHADRLRQQAVAIDYMHAAISDEDGTAELHIPVSQNGIPFGLDAGITSLSLRTSTEFKYEQVRVPGFTLDTALKSLAVDRSVAWIDVEGAQGRIIAGGHRYFSRVLALYIELERERYWRGQLLDSEVVESLAKFSLVPIMRDNLASGQYNEVFIRMDKDIADAALLPVLRYIEELRAMLGVASSA